MAQDKNQPRFFFMELIAYWEGRINATALERQFNITRQLASDLIKSYRALAPNNICYNASQKAYITNTSEFNRLHISGDVTQYLNWIQSGHICPQTIHPTLALSSLALSLPPRQVSPLLIQKLVAAMRKNLRLEVNYVSVSNPDGAGRIITPHSFVNTGLRWHLRAYCEKSREYRDFVLSRFRGEPELLNKSEHTAAQDTAWNTPVDIIVQPNPALTPEQQTVIANDYQMHNNQLTITTKACLVHYWLQEMQINPTAKNATPTAQPLIVVNSEAINAWLFDAEKINTCKQI